LARVKSSESKLTWALVRCALYSYCRDKIVKEHGNLLDALDELQISSPDKPAEWFYRATYRLLAGKVERVGSEHWLVKGLAELGDTYPWYNMWVSEGRYRYDCFFSIRLREEGKNLHAHRHSHAAQEVAEAARRMSLKAASPHVTSSML